MDNTTAKLNLIAIVKPPPVTEKYLAHIRRKIVTVSSHQERAALALIALSLEAELKGK